MSHPPPLHIQLFGNFRLLAGDAPVTTVNTPRLQALLAYLVLHRNAPHLRQQLAFQLWPDSAEGQARTNLRKLFFQLQHALPHADYFLLANTQTLGWNTQAEFTLDVAELQQRLIHLQNEPIDLEALRRVVELYQGELLPSCYDDWIVPLRQQLHQAVMGAMERLITLLENQQAYETGIHYAQRLLAFDPLEEKTYQRLMRLHALDGNYTSALRVYQECVAMLQRELDVEPDAETQVLYERLRQRDASLIAKVEQKARQAERLPLVGRQHEWQTLQNAWRQTVQGQTHFVCIWGEAGIGKTRLAEELLDWTEKQGILTARTRSYQTHGALAYAPVVELLRNPALFSRLTRLGQTWLSEVARLLPELLDEQHSLAAPQPMRESWQRQRFFEALARAVLVDDQPLLLIFDDLHWCDHETMAWLTYLLHFAPHARLLVVGTSRIEAVDDAHPLAALRLGLRREALVTEIELAPLTNAEVTTLARTLAEHDLTGEQSEQLYADTEGNPLFVVETVRAVWSEGGKEEKGGDENSTPRLRSSSPSTLPPKVQAVIHARLTQLSPSAQKIASLAAVIGRSFSFAVLLAAAHTDEDTLIDSLDELSERRILREQAADGYDFSHDRIREVAYSDLSRARRRQLHRHVAEALQTVYASSLDEVSGPLAEHYTQTGDDTNAIQYLQRAGDRAAQIYVYREALTFYNRALALVSTIEKSESNRNQQQRIMLLIKIADIHVFFGEYTLAQKSCEEGLALARAQGDSQSLADSHRILGRVADYQGRYVEAEQLYQVALVLYRDRGDKIGEARVLNNLGIIASNHGEYVKAEQFYQAALLIHKDTGYRMGEAFALGNLGTIADNQGEYVKAEQFYQAALMIHKDTGYRMGEELILNNLGIAAYNQGDYAQAEQFYQAALMILREIGNRMGEAYLLNNLGLVADCQARYTQAEQLYQEALTIIGDTDNRYLEAEILSSLGYSAFRQKKIQMSRQCFYNSLAIGIEIRHVPVTLSSLVGIAHLLTQESQKEQALHLLGLALHSSSIETDAKKRGILLLTELQAEMRAETVNALLQVGEQLNLEQVVQGILAVAK